MAASVRLQQKVNISWGQGSVPLTQQAVQVSGGGLLSDTCTSSAAWQRPAPRVADGPPGTAPTLQNGCPAQVLMISSSHCHQLLFLH